MRFNLTNSRLTWTVSSFAMLLSGAIIAGCDSGTDSPEVKQQAQARVDGLKQEEDKADAALKQKLGKNAPTLRSIKGGIKTDQPGKQ